jgi:hypothetical protein
MSSDDIHVDIPFYRDEIAEISDQTDDIDEWICEAVQKRLDSEADE